MTMSGDRERARGIGFPLCPAGKNLCRAGGGLGGFPATDPEEVIAGAIGKESIAVASPQQGEGLRLFVAVEPLDESLHREGTEGLLQQALIWCRGALLGQAWRRD